MARRLRAWSVTLGVWVIVASAPLGHLPAAQAEQPAVDEGIEERYLTLEQALRITLPDAETVTPEERTLTAAQRERIERESGRPVLQPTVTVHVGRRGGQVNGYALVMEETGMYKPITSVVGVTPEGRVQEVAVMVYRESRGGDVRRKRFLSQYRGKRLADPIRINKDIINVTGATLSVRSMNAQVRKALAVVSELFLQGGN